MALKRELRDRHVEQIELAKVTKFTWDELFLFGPYEPASDICKTLRLSSAECESAITVTSTDDGEMLMVFRHKGRIVHSEVHMRWHGDFSPIPQEPLTPQTAVFAVSIEGKGASGEDWLVLRPVSTQHPSQIQVTPPTSTTRPSLTVRSTRTPIQAMPSAFSWPVLVPSALRAPAPVN